MGFRIELGDPMTTKPATLGELRKLPGYAPGAARRTVKEELRANLLKKLDAAEPLFSGIHGYDETVLPQIANAILARHNFILLGLRGQAKSRILRGLVDFLDLEIPYIAGCQIHDNPQAPLCRSCRDIIAASGDTTPFAGGPVTRASSKNSPRRTSPSPTYSATWIPSRRRARGAIW